MSGFASTTAALQSTSATAGSSQINSAFGGFVTDGGPGANTLTGVVARGSSDVWAVGSATDATNRRQTLILHWNGTAWAIVPSPNLGSHDNDLRGVAAVGATELWAVGSAVNAQGLNDPLALHWNGTAWTLATPPRYGALDNWLYGVSGADPADVWAVGSYINGSQSTPLALHWDGAAWRQVTSPGGGSYYNVLLGVAARTANDVWAVGYAADSQTALLQPLLQHYVDSCVLLTPTPVVTASPTATATSTGTPPLPVTATPTACTIAFTDVDPANPFYPFIRCLACRGVFSGYADGTFRWGANVTRGQTAKIVANAAQVNDSIPPAQQTFSDAAPASPFWLWIERLAGRGVISGYPCGGPGEPCDPTLRPYFRPGADVTRGQLAKIVAETAHFADPVPTAQQTFHDVDAANPFWRWIERLAGRGVISGYACGGPGEPCDPQGRPYFRWGAPTTRGQLAKIAAQTFFPACQTPARP